MRAAALTAPDVAFLTQLGFATWVYEKRTPGPLNGSIVASVLAGALLTVLLCFAARSLGTWTRLLTGAIAGHFGGVASYLILSELVADGAFVLVPAIGLLEVGAAILLIPAITWSWVGGAAFGLRVGCAASARVYSTSEAAQQHNED